MSVSGNEDVFVHFALPGWSNTICNEVFPGDTQWSGTFDVDHDWQDSGFTMHVDKTTCPTCTAMIATTMDGLVDDLPPMSPEPKIVELAHYDRAVGWLKSVGNNVTDELAIQAAGVYASLAIADELRKVNTGMEGLREYLAGVVGARGDEDHV